MITAARRTSVESRPKYSASPPKTPAERPMVLVSGHRGQNPGGDVGDESPDEHARNDGEDHPDKADDGDVRIEVGGQAGAHSREFTLIGNTHESPVCLGGPDRRTAKAAVRRLSLYLSLAFDASHHTPPRVLWYVIRGDRTGRSEVIARIAPSTVARFRS